MAPRPGLGAETRGLLLVLTSAAGFGTLAIFAKLAYAAGVDQLLALNWRFILAALLLAAWVGFARLPWRVQWKEAIILLLLGGVGYAAMSSLFFAALGHITASATSMLLYTYPALVSLLSYLIWRTPLSRRHLTALIASGFGTFLLLWSPELRLNPAGTVFALGSAFVYSFYLLANQHLTPGVDPAVGSTYIITGAALTFTAINLARGTFTAVLPLAGWLPLLLMAVFSTTLAISTLLAGIRRLGAARASILSTFEPLVTVALAIAFLGERLSPIQALGGIFIAAGVILPHLPAPGRRANLPG